MHTVLNGASRIGHAWDAVRLSYTVTGGALVRQLEGVVLLSVDMRD